MQRQVDKYEKLCQKAEAYKSKIYEIKAATQNGNYTTADVAKIDELQMKLSSVNQEIEKQTTGIEKVYAKIDKVKSKQEQNNEKMQEYKDKIESINISNLESRDIVSR